MSPNEANVVPIQSIPNTKRISEVKNKYEDKFKKSPDFFVRVPGRVNLIGEHIDYCGYGVCPMAVQQDILLAVGISEDSSNVLLSNIDPVYEDFESNLYEISIDIDGKPQWYEYFLCGVKGILSILPSDVPLKGFAVVVSGNIPPNAGLSSSSALVSAAALATAHLHKFSISKEKMANLCAECERYIGTQGGGMDQAIAFLATEGCAKLIEFSPLRSKDVFLPPGAVFVIAHSLARLNKAATSDFNCRVVECRLAAQLLAKMESLDWTKINKLGELQEALKSTLPEMIALVDRKLTEISYSREDILRTLETTSAVLEEVSLTPNTKDVAKFKLRQRALHVFQEANRVQRFYSKCSAYSAKSETTLQALGSLMSESHESLRDYYECSHPQLDRLVDLSREFTFGTRLTGAGWGGCAVALVPPENVDKYISFLKENFYKDCAAQETLDSLIFATAPNCGACIYQNENPCSNKNC